MKAPSPKSQATSPKKKMTTQKNNPLHNITLEQIMIYLVENLGWGNLALEIKINCFRNDPSIKSSLTFLRKMPWARAKVENFYLSLISQT